MREHKDTFSAIGAADVTPNDSADIGNAPCRGLYIGVTGDVRVTLAGMADGAHVTFANVPVGFAPLQAKRVWSTGTTATDIKALF